MTSPRRIFKYELKYELSIGGAAPDRRIIIDMPTGATILHVGSQGHDNPNPILWAMVPDMEAPAEPRLFGIVGDGQRWPWPDDLPADRASFGTTSRYIGTAVCYGGELVWHVFEPLWHGAWGE